MSVGAAASGRILLIDADVHRRGRLTEWLGQEGHAVSAFGDVDEGIGILRTLRSELVLLAAAFPLGRSGDTLERIRRTHAHLPVIMLLDDDGSLAATWLERGAYDYLPAPLLRDKALTCVRNGIERGRMAIRLVQLEREAMGRGYEGLVGTSPAMRELFRQLDQLAASDVSIVLIGESGTGKELVARAAHNNSGRAAGPFVALNCAAIPETLQESELFGHERGAFTGATARRAGRFEAADGGTLFLDEVAELSPSLQAKLLRALQERSFYRVGGDVEIESDFRLIAASHRDLLTEVRAGRFREDLYFRIAVYELEIPPLRDREADLLQLAEHFLGVFSPERKFDLSPEVVGLMQRYAWPGNVRELQNAMQRAVVSAADGVVRARDLPRTIRGVDPNAESRPPWLAASPTPSPSEVSGLHRLWGADPVPNEPSSRAALGRLPVAAPEPTFATIPEPQRLQELERTAIERALARTGGSMKDAARALGISRATLYRKVERYGLK